MTLGFPTWGQTTVIEIRTLEELLVFLGKKGVGDLIKLKPRNLVFAGPCRHSESGG